MTFLSYFWFFLVNTTARTDGHSSDYHKHRLPIQREEPRLMHTQPTEWSSRVGPFTFLINWCADTRDLDASPQSWLDCIRSGKKLSWSGKFVFISSFPALAVVCRRSVIHMRDGGGWWDGGCYIQYLAYVREIIIGTNTSVLLCSATSHTPRQWTPIVTNQRPVL